MPPEDIVDPNTVTIPNPGGEPPAPTPITYPELSAIIPPEFKDKPWVKDTKDVPSFVKRFDSLLTEIGKKPAAIPQDNASDDEWKAFHKAFGVPEKPEEYEIPTEEGLPTDEGFLKDIRGVFQKAGVSKRQGKIITEGYNQMLKAQVEAQKNFQAESDKKFDELALQAFGERKDKVLETGRAFIAKYAPKLPEGLRQHIEKMPNESLVTMAAILDGMAKDYVNEDQLPVGGGGVGSGNEAERREEAKKLMASEAYSNQFHKDHDAVFKKVQELYKPRG